MIEVSHLTKRYGDHNAVEDLSFTIENGKVYGFLGPNGAGKSTTMNIITGCLSATEGTVTIDGHDIFEEPREAKKNIGFLPELPPVYLDSTIREYLTFVAEAKEMPRAEIKDEVNRVMGLTKITHYENRLIKNLSKGYRQRVGIAQALVGNPETIILDEPTVGLDPQQIIDIRDLIVELGKDHTVILSSHILSEVQAVCSTILIIAQGKLIACDTAENLEKQFSGKLMINLIADCGKTQAKNILKNVQDISDTTIVDRAGNQCEISLASVSEDTDAILRRLFRAFADDNVPLLKMVTNQATLEDIFIELTNAANEEIARKANVKEA